MGTLPDEVYEITFRGLDGTKEVQQYSRLADAKEVYKTFFEPGCIGYYLDITLTEYNFRTRKEKVIYKVDFAKDWREWKPGRKTTFEYHDFDGSGCVSGIITETGVDYAIMEADGMRLRIDDDSSYMFR